MSIPHVMYHTHLSMLILGLYTDADIFVLQCSENSLGFCYS